MDSKELRLFREAYGSIYEGYGKKKKGDCVDKEDKGEHNCAKKVCHESFGEGTCIFGEHAVPDENGFVSHYDVMFEHGIERNVPVADMEVLEEGSHNEENHRYSGEQIDEAGYFIPSRIDDFNADSDRLRNMGKPYAPKIIAPGGGQYKEPPSYRTGVIKLANSGPALPGEPGRPGTPKAPDGRPHLPGEKQTPAPKKKMSLQLAGADLFDIVKGHLVSEGLTEEEAIQKMVTMTEKERNEILEGLTPDEEQRRRNLSKAINKAGTPGYPGVDSAETRKMQGEYIQLQQKLKGV